MKLAGKTALITGAARRIGAQSAKTLHENGVNIIIHYGRSSKDAENLVAQLNLKRAESAVTLQADLLNIDAIHQLAIQAFNAFDGLDILVNNASTFYPTPLGSINETNWNDLMGTNIKAPMFLSQACYPALKQSKGCIINMVDIHARSPLKDYITYSCAKAAKVMLTRSLAREMGPEVRVNAIAPGAILWPEDENELDIETQQKILQEIPLKRAGSPADIADTILFLVTSDYINGQVIAVDGGRQLF
ncbi:MAG: pteridine reductase [Gammaproteobacteria bacterium]|nr:pteridine reductase [Gammaproteobacteria bacterium]